MEQTPEWANNLIKKVDEFENQLKQNCSKIDALDEKIEKLPVKIKQDLLPQLITEIRNSVRSELERKF